jgi:hypothetical protein
MNREESLRVMQLIRLQSAQGQAHFRARWMAENALRNGAPVQPSLQYQTWHQQGRPLAGTLLDHIGAPQMTDGHQHSPSLVRYLRVQAMQQWIRQKEREQLGAQNLVGPSALMASHFAPQHGSPPAFLEPRGEVTVSNNGTHSGFEVATALHENGPRCLPAPISDPMDVQLLSERQVFLRQQLEVFTATEIEAFTHARGRNKRVQHGQVGIRCRHCAHMSVVTRQKGSTYFPSTIAGLYQAAQNMCTTHMQTGVCTAMPTPIQQEFALLLCMPKACSGSGRKYWAESVKKFGLVDTDHGIFQSDNIPSSAHIITHH